MISDYLKKNYPEMNKAYFKLLADSFNLLENKDQVKVFRYFTNMYTNQIEEERNVDGIMHVLDKIPYDNQVDIIDFFIDLYDPD